MTLGESLRVYLKFTANEGDHK